MHRVIADRDDLSVVVSHPYFFIGPVRESAMMRESRRRTLRIIPRPGKADCHDPLALGLIVVNLLQAEIRDILFLEELLRVIQGLPYRLLDFQQCSVSFADAGKYRLGPSTAKPSSDWFIW